jgi:flagellar basal-body rod modification protein FlgD
MSSVSTLSGLVDSASAAGINNGTTSATELNDRFLKLLVAQMNNQDPLNPLDNAEVTSQMAQINTVTGINGLNDTVVKLLDQFARLESMQAAQLTGRSVLVDGDTLALAEGGTATGGIDLATAADKVTIEIRDSAGQVVRELQLGKNEAGVARFDWDGKNAAGVALPAGNYTFTAKASVGQTDVIAVPLAMRKVEGVRQVNGAVQLVLNGGGTVPYTDVRQIL